MTTRVQYRYKNQILQKVPITVKFPDSKTCTFSQGCTYVAQVPSPCLSTEFECKDHITCIHKSFMCDGDKDCPDGGDEDPIRCKNITCREDQFQCKDRSCIPGQLYCSGTAECADGSDEVNCSKFKNSLR